MLSTIIIITFLQSIFFKIFHLSSRRLQEKGASARGVVFCQRLAIVPALVFFATQYDHATLQIIFSDTRMSLMLLGIMCFRIVGQYIGIVLLNATYSLSFLAILSDIINVPILIAFWMLVNHDVPNLYVILSLVFLLSAVFFRPTQHEENKTSILKYTLPLTIFFIVAVTVAHAVDGSFYREFLTTFDDKIPFIISIYILITSIMMNIFSYAKKIPKTEIAIIKKNRYIALAIPFFWFIASLPEGFSYANIPVYSIVSISSIAFLLTIFSDLKNKRIRFNYKTVVFCTLAILNIVFFYLSLK